MPRPGPRLPVVALRLDPSAVDNEAAIESRAQGRDVTRSEMLKLLITEALTARQRRRNRKARE